MTEDYKLEETEISWTVDDTLIKGIETILIGTNLSIATGTNGIQGGDYGHGGRTFIVLNTTGEMNLTIFPLSSEYNQNDYMYDGMGNFIQPADGVAIETGGDWELDALIEGFQWIVDKLKQMRNNK